MATTEASAYTKSGSSPPRPTRRAWTTPGFHSDTRKPDGREVPDHAFILKMEEGERRWARGKEERHFVVFVPETRYRPKREDNAWIADPEIQRLLDEPPANVSADTPVAAEHFERPPGIKPHVWGLLLSVDVRGGTLADAMRRMGITGTAAQARTRKAVDRARKVWMAHLTQGRGNTALSKTEEATS
jgi:hypothetical protein